MNQSKSMTSVGPSWNPVGLRVMVVDDDKTCLILLKRMLEKCEYEVKTYSRATSALSVLRENRNGFDLVISDVHMPDMDGFKLLEHIGLEMDLPVIMMSADDSNTVVMKGVTHGACDYLIKPVRMEALKNIWQHVVRKKKNDRKEVEHFGSLDEGQQQKQSEDAAENSSSANEEYWRNSKKRKNEDDEADDKDDSSTLKKPRVVWSVELHQQFVAAVNQLSIDKAVPKKILELMNVPGLTRENVASHLQKYRLYLRRLSGMSQLPGNNNSFMTDQGYGQFNGMELQALAAASGLPTQSLATLQASGLVRPSVNPGISMSVVDQSKIFSFDNPKLRFLDGQQQLSATADKQMNLLHGIPTSMEAKQLPGLHHPVQSLATMNMQQINHTLGVQSSPHNSLLMHMSQPHTRDQSLHESTNSRVNRLPLSVGRPVFANGRLGIPSSIRGTSTFSPMSQTSPLLNYANHSSTLPGGSYSPGMSSFASRGTFQHEISNSEAKGHEDFFASFDVANEKAQDWDLQNMTLPFDFSQHSNSLNRNLDVAPSVVVSQGFSSTQPNGLSRIVSGGTGNANTQQMVQNNNFYGEHLVRVKSERLSDTSTGYFQEQYNTDGLMSPLRPRDVMPDNDFEAYSIDIPISLVSRPEMHG